MDVTSNPSQSIYGCVNLSGTPLIAGVYNATVTVIATLQVLGDQTISYIAILRFYLTLLVILAFQ